ncbi:MAG: 3-phosphoshikimate 1-carboxyvinyltransferase [Deltaproteobacteria bacterium]|nr:3-phosphoshikimate 1-carboxyvinyltransferase [Candidatus Anaeroferrophillus wilburensis]MBN2889358.1 3-phosphoshikimate 1-carboxyvinyltransferase [Deltaproteobacteria bacterium]
MTTRTARSLQGTITVPGDKSISHRAIIMAALAEGKSRLQGFLRGEDTLNTANIFSALGISITGLEKPGDITVHGRGLHGLREAADILYTGNSGTTTRLLAGLLSAQPFFSILSGDRSINQRPMGRVITPLRQMGAAIWGRQDDSLPPLAIKGKQLHAICHSSPVASAQVKSCLMLAGLYVDDQLTINEPVLSRDHTERMFRAFGIKVSTTTGKTSPATICMTPPAANFPGTDFIIPGDISAAAFFLVAALINRHSSLKITNVGINPTRSGIIQVLQSMGGAIAVENQREACGEPVADLIVEGSNQLKGVEISGTLIPSLIDEIPILALAAAHAEGVTVIRDAQELRVKESDRLQAITLLLQVMGVKTEPLPDGIVIHGGIQAPTKEPLSFTTFGDHRIAMTAMVAGTTLENKITIDHPECIGTSFPGFAQLLSNSCQ